MEVAVVEKLAVGVAVAARHLHAVEDIREGRPRRAILPVGFQQSLAQRDREVRLRIATASNTPEYL